MRYIEATTAQIQSNLWVRRIIAALAGTFIVALGAQAAVPMPGTPVPMTLQVPAVLIAGGLLGARVGASSLGFYILLGALGLPVFAAGGALGIARLIGPTGGYLLAYPLAAAVMGHFAARKSGGPLVLGLLASLAVIHLGGVAQLLAITGDASQAFVWGSLPFVAGDILKLAFAGLIVWRFGPKTRALL